MSLYLPVRGCVYALLMPIFGPLMVTVSTLRALYVRVREGRASSILRCQQDPYGTSFNFLYPAQMVFTKPFSDTDKLEKVYRQLLDEVEVPQEKGGIVFESEAMNSTEFPKTDAFDADFYVGESGSNWLTNGSTLKLDANYYTYLRVWNGKPGAPTVIHLYLQGGAWDGTSCFNFMKELINRYYSGPKAHKEVAQCRKLTLKEESAKKLDMNFGWFLLRQARAVLLNTHYMVWQAFCTSPKYLGGPGLGVHMCVLNFDEKDSKLLKDMAGKMGVKPFAAFTYAGVKAYNEVLGYSPRAIVQQASMQTRHYEPKMEREIIGDWLIGPLQYIKQPYSVKKAQSNYDKLYNDLDNIGDSVKHTFNAKAYGVFRGGAAKFECFPFYGDDASVFKGIFFNNYGARTVVEEAGLYSWNWGAPMQLGYNTIHINGKTCICFATCCIGMEQLRAIRDNVEGTLRGLMAGVDPDSVLDNKSD